MGGRGGFGYKSGSKRGFSEAHTLIYGINIADGETFPEASALTDSN